ncbi:Hypothetical protein SRAE_2000261900 [Strongyloides ratti]|uniref:Peptidase_S9 domain-containing protein n=1 Tax=Strongyloides ratti TaxID=34506 RepID=A0A090LII9_STRRB|nr:Hypothetical protein SRAE_2000261900 [Strongyloides ratti]CEF67958.1 Hypothetical protein SRAE_2000261900 [Strongyloides ratti]
MSKSNSKTNLNNKTTIICIKNSAEVRKKEISKCDIVKRLSDTSLNVKNSYKLKENGRKKYNLRLSDKKVSYGKEKICKNSKKHSKSKKKSSKKKKISPIVNSQQNNENYDLHIKTSSLKKNKKDKLLSTSETDMKKQCNIIRKVKSVPLQSIPFQKCNQNKPKYSSKFNSKVLIENEFDENFLERLKITKKNKQFIQCNCVVNESSWSIFSNKSKKLWLNAKNLFKIFFIPEAERNFTQKAIFWPQKSNYYFYQIKNYEDKSFNIQHLYLMNKYRSLTLNDSLNENTRTKLEEAYSNIISFVTDEDEPQGEFLFGHNHPCYVFTDKVKFFFIKDNENGETIPCAYTITGKPTKYTLIYSHPNAYSLEDLIIGFPSLYDIAQFLNVEIIAYEYPGYGICDGIPTEERLINRLTAVYDYLTKEKNILPSEIILLGYSLGGALSIMAAANNKNIGGLILFATPASFKSCIKYKLFCSSSVNDKKSNEPFDVIFNIQMIKCPTLVIHSKSDKLVPISHCDTLLKYLGKKAEYLTLEDTLHNGTERNFEVWLTVKKFLFEDLPRKKEEISF